MAFLINSGNLDILICGNSDHIENNWFIILNFKRTIICGILESIFSEIY